MCFEGFVIPSTKLQDCFLPNPFQFITSLFIYNHVIRRPGDQLLGSDIHISIHFNTILVYLGTAQMPIKKLARVYRKNNKNLQIKYKIRQFI
jgi:hypothetical protein